MPMFSREDVDLYYECHGSGAPLFLIAGLASDSQSWQPIIGDLAAHFRVIALDNRGVGRTIPQDAPTSIRAMADDCVALIDHLRLPSVHVLGHSMGGFIAQELAIRRADKVNALILAATASASCRRNNELFRGWANALANGANRSAWFRNLSRRRRPTTAFCSRFRPRRSPTPCHHRLLLPAPHRSRVEGPAA